MIQNLISAVLVSMAVGGNTATAFHKEPQYATSETTITENYSVNLADKRTLINTLTETETGITRNLKTYRYLDSQNNYLIQGNTYTFDETWTNKRVEEQVVYTTSMSVSILKCVPYYNVELDNSTFTFIAQAYWQSNALYGDCDFYTEAKAILYNPATNLDNGINKAQLSKSQIISMYTEIQNFNANFVLDTDSDYYPDTIYPNDEDDPQWSEMPVSLNIAEYNLNAKTPFYITLTSQVVVNVEDDGDLTFTNYQSVIQNPTGTLYFNESWTEGGSTAPPQIEVIDIPNLMYTIMTMPFSFVSQAFNLTLFPNTPYQINVSSIVLLILTILIVMFITRIVIRFIR